MALKDFLYRCPYCGRDPLEGVGDEARCGSCRRRYRRGTEPRGIQVIEDDGESEEVSARHLGDRIRELDGDLEAEGGSGGGVILEADVTAQVAEVEEPIRYRGALLGFVERAGPELSGTLRVTGRELQFVPDDGAARQWSLLDVRALQTASASVQISSVEGGVVTFAFSGDSPKRWEETLKRLLRRSWREEGRGEIFEFQPRIRAR